MKKKIYEIELFGKVWKLELRKGEYMTNNRLAIEAITDDGEVFATLTVNLGGFLPDNYAFIDTNNNSWAEAFLQENKIATPTGHSCSSGYCLFPLYEFDEKVLSGLANI